MREESGDLWEFTPKGYNHVWRGIPTNGVVNKGKLVMGAGVAKQARDSFTNLDKALGQLVQDDGNIPQQVVVHYDEDDPEYLFSFPTKNHYNQPSDEILIMKSAIAVAEWALQNPADAFVMPRPGVGLGKLEWDDIRPMLLALLPDNVFVVTI